MKNLITKFDKLANEIMKEFIIYMWWNEYDVEYWQWIWEPGGTMDFGEWNFFYSLDDMVDVLRNQYDPKVVEAHYDYQLYHRGEEWEYGINLKNFALVFKGWSVEEFAKVYHEETDKNRAYWESPEGKAETEKIMQKMTDKFLAEYGIKNEI